MNTECNGCGAQIEPRSFWDAYCEKCQEELSAAEPPQWVPEREAKPTIPQPNATGWEILDLMSRDRLTGAEDLGRHIAFRMLLIPIMLPIFLIVGVPVLIAVCILSLTGLI